MAPALHSGSLPLGILSLVLASGGLYGLMAFQVANRRHEIGLRMALGAPRSQVLLVLRQSLALVAAGAMIGTAWAIFAARLASSLSLLYQVSEADPLGIAAAFAILSAVALLAASQPARRAMTVDPVVGLKAE